VSSRGHPASRAASRATHRRKWDPNSRIYIGLELSSFEDTPGTSTCPLSRTPRESRPETDHSEVSSFEDVSLRHSYSSPLTQWSMEAKNMGLIPLLRMGAITSASSIVFTLR